MNMFLAFAIPLVFIFSIAGGQPIKPMPREMTQEERAKIAGENCDNTLSMTEPVLTEKMRFGDPEVKKEYAEKHAKCVQELLNPAPKPRDTKIAGR